VTSCCAKCNAPPLSSLIELQLIEEHGTSFHILDAQNTEFPIHFRILRLQSKIYKTNKENLWPLANVFRLDLGYWCRSLHGPTSSSMRNNIFLNALFFHRSITLEKPPRPQGTSSREIMVWDFITIEAAVLLYHVYSLGERSASYTIIYGQTLLPKARSHPDSSSERCGGKCRLRVLLRI